MKREDNMSDLPPTRADARTLGLKYFFTGTPCKHGHIAERRASNGHCAECGRENNRKWCAANLDKLLERNRKWRAANPEKAREQSRKLYAASPDKQRERTRKWREDNPEKRAAVRAARRARKIQATPPWADTAAIKAIYAECARVSAETGIQHHVDHIAPLRGRAVCGLHVETNLRVIPAADNIAKSNKMTGECEIETARKLERTS